MALLNKTNVPLEPIQAGTSGHNYYGEVAKIQALAAATATGSLTISGPAEWESPTSGITYNTEDAAYAEQGNINNKGEFGLLNLLIYLYGTYQGTSNKFLMTAEDWNTVVEQLEGYATGSSRVEVANYATKIGSGTTSHPSVGNPTQPVYVKNTGEIVPATAYSEANVSHANTASVAYQLGTTTVGSASTPVYLANGVPTASTNVAAATAAVASKLGTNTVGGASTPIFLNAGTPTACTNVEATSASTAATAATLATPRTLQVDLASVQPSTGFDGSADISNIGVTGTLNVANGGTGVGGLRGSATNPVFLALNGITACTHQLRATVNNSNANDFTNPPLACYSSANNIVSLSTTTGSATQPVYIDNGVIMPCANTLGASVSTGAEGRLAFYQTSGLVRSFGQNVGNNQQLIYLNGGIPTAGIKITYGTDDPPATANVGDIYIKI